MLEIQDAGFHYPRRDWVFRHANLRIEGGITSILGPNGQGKTTLLRCIAGLTPLREGRVERDTAIGYVPQAALSSFAYSVFDMVLMGRAKKVSAFAVPGRADIARTREVLDRVGIGNLARRSFAELSGGQRQLVLIARALASDATFMILDEPVSAWTCATRRGCWNCCATSPRTAWASCSRRTIRIMRCTSVGARS